MNSDGTNFHWVYISPADDDDSFIKENRPIITDIFDHYSSSKLSWSADKKYLVFDSIAVGCCESGAYQIMKLNIQTGKLEKINTNLTNGFHEPLVY